MAASAVPPRVLSGLLGLGLGGFALLALLGLLNRPSEAPPDVAAQARTSFQVAPKPPEPKARRKQRPRRRPSRARPRAAVPSAPRVGNALSGLSLGLDPGGLGDLDAVDRSLLGDTRDVAMTEDTVDTPPTPLERAPPEVPLRLRKRGITGSVVLNLLIDKDGTVAKVKVLSSEPAGVFDEIAVEAAQRWRFRPGSNQGQPCAVWMNAPIEFRY